MLNYETGTNAGCFIYFHEQNIVWIIIMSLQNLMVKLILCYLILNEMMCSLWVMFWDVSGRLVAPSFHELTSG